eukprot:CAMPEP_0204587938 /NCGR_PEP_ID=MMETSP0661-20131031/48331_1 /ASSEMBLY_ACC=CAM_ASM_000606 /TAXON_ID=109239 /ORGANISM="Alexandrium margalefi, Strain AMGDE01CS-322" /LENGTH=428 /DNA_ID=CAMNT_0051597701 /DNA_START=222 /DNA_END=1508 /DNA_ORIENTATION=-
MHMLLNVSDEVGATQDASDWVAVDEVKPSCQWVNTGHSIPTDEGSHGGSVRGSSQSCESQCDDHTGCTAFARCGSTCWIKRDKQFTAAEPTKHVSACTWHYRKCSSQELLPDPKDPGCYLKTSKGLFKLIGEDKPGWSSSNCTEKAGGNDPIFVRDPAAPKPVGARIRFGSQNIMGWVMWCKRKDNWKHLADRVKKYNIDIVAWQEFGDRLCGSQDNAPTKWGPNKGLRILDSFNGRTGMNASRWERMQLTYNPKTIKFIGSHARGAFTRDRFMHIESGVTFGVFSVHTGCWKGHPCCQVLANMNDDVAELRRKFPNDGYVSMGDFNTWGVGYDKGFAMNYMRGKNDCWGKPQLPADRAWKFANDGEGQTYCEYAGCSSRFIIDYILYSKEFEKKWSKTMQPPLVEYGVNTKYSDHTLIMSDLYMGKK